MPMLKVALHPQEREALQKLSASERRDPRAQAAVIIRRELERVGLLDEAKPVQAPAELEPTNGRAK